MELNQLRQFIRVAELEHMTKAAKSLYIAQPALSKTIRLLEAELGVQLFDRVGKNILLNESGGILLRHARGIFDHLDGIQVELQSVKKEYKKEIVLAMPAASATLPLLISGFWQRHPEIRIKIVQYMGQEEGDWDICVCASLLQMDIPNYWPLLQEELILALPRTHPFANCESIELAEAANQPFISLKSDTSHGNITSKYCYMAGFRPNIILESDNPSTVRELLGKGLGISLIPSVTWRSVKSEEVCFIRISKPTCTRYLGIMWRDSSVLSDNVMLFRDYTVDFFRQLSGEIWV
ncbi:MAG: LysR family transcriptional regulator [Lachnospiraceae bacterium]